MSSGLAKKLRFVFRRERPGLFLESRHGSGGGLGRRRRPTRDWHTKGQEEFFLPSRRTNAKQARRLATRLAAEDGPVSAELRGLLDDRLSLAANYTSAAAVLAVLVLMVFQP